MMAVLGMLSAFTVTAAELQWQSDSLKVVEPGRRPGEKTFSLAAPAMRVLSQAVPVNPSRRYRLSGWLRSGAADNLSISCFGLVMQDARGRNILKSNVDAVPRSDTALLQTAKKGAMELTIKDGANWEKRRSVRTMVAFNVKPEFADLPNFELSPIVTRVRKAGDGASCIVTLSKPLEKEYPAETPVRQHRYGEFFYGGIAYSRVPAQWTRFTAEIGGMAVPGAPAGKFWANTKAVRVMLMSDAARKGAELQFSDIIFEEVKE